MATLARGQVTIVDLNDAKALQCYLQSNQGDSQLYDPATLSYTPDYTTSNMVVTPKIYVTGSASTVESKCSNFKWNIDGSALSTSGTSGTIVNGGGSDTNIGCSVSSTTGALTITKNIIKDNLALSFECDYTDNGITTHITSQKTIIKTSAASTLFQCIITTPKGDTFDASVASTETLTATCSAYHGATPCTNVKSYKWQYLDLASGTFKDKGVTTQTLTVSRDEVLNFQTFKCVVTDGEDTSKTCESIITFRDQTDPYTIDMVVPGGTSIKNGTGSVDIYARIYRGTELIESEATESANRTFYYKWTRYDQNGANATVVVAGTTKGVNSYTASASEITNKATYFVEISNEAFG